MSTKVEKFYIAVGGSAFHKSKGCRHLRYAVRRGEVILLALTILRQTKDTPCKTCKPLGEGKTVLNPWDGKPITCRRCKHDKFNDRGRSLDTYNHECVACMEINHTMTETGMSA